MRDVFDRLALATIALLALSCAVVGVPSSGATWSDSSSTQVAVSAADDWTAPTVTLVDPGALVSGTVPVTAIAADDRSTVASVLIEYDAPGLPDSWVPLCTDTTAPYTCAWDSTAVPDDAGYRLRATATDTQGLQGTSGAVSTRVKNYTITLQALPAAIHGTVTLGATWQGLGTPSVAFQRSPTGIGSWTTLTGCGARTAAPVATCSWDTTSVDSQRWFLRVTLTYAGTTYADSPAGGVIVDNVVPMVVLTLPDGTLYGTVVMSAAADDTDPNPGDASSGVASVLFEYRRQGVTTWTACGTDTTAPYSCSLATGALTDGPYEFRATATDGAGNVTTTATQSGTVNNTSPWVKVMSPADGATIAQGADLTVTADAFAAAGIASVRLEYDAPGNPATFATICTDTTAPYSCPWETLPIAAGSTEIRAVMTPVSGPKVTSGSVFVTIQQLAALEVQGTPSEGTGGLVKPGTGDVLTFTWSTVVTPGSIKAGWDGTATPVALTFHDRNVVAGQAIANRDWVSFTDSALGQVAFSQAYVSSGSSVVFGGSTMVATTETVGGVPRTVVRVTLGTPDPLTASRLTSAGSGTMTWTPTTSVTSVDGSVSTGASAIETGSLDKDL